MKKVSLGVLATLFVCCGIYLLLSGILFLEVPSYEKHKEIDSYSYLSQVENYERYGSFIEPAQATCTNMMGIGYPMFMVGVRMVGGRNPYAVIGAQLLLALLSLLLTFLLASYFFTVSVALLAAFLFSISVGLILYPYFILTEMLNCFLLLLGLERFCKYTFSNQKHALITSGFVFGLSVIVKGAALFYIPFMCLLLLLINTKTFFLKMISILIFVAAFSAPVGAYVWRNKQIFGYYYLQTLSRVNLYSVFLEKVVMFSEGISEQDAFLKVCELNSGVHEYASGKGWEQSQKLLWEKVTHSPFAVAYIWFINVLKTYCGLFTNHLKVLIYPHIRGGDCSFFKFSGSWWQRAWQYLSFGTSSGWLIGLGIFEILFTLLRYALALLVLVYLLSRGFYFEFLIFSSWIIYFPLLTGFDGCGRYRIVIEPVLSILAAQGFFLLKDFRKKI